MTKVKVVRTVCGDILYKRGTVIDLPPETARVWVEAGAAEYAEDEHPVAKKLEQPKDLHPEAKEIKAEAPKGATATAPKGNKAAAHKGKTAKKR